jgi:DNA-binding NtrC family response regulator
MIFACESVTMTSPKTPQQLANAIEAMVASYVDEVRRSVQQAVERSWSRPVVSTRTAKRRTAGSQQSSTTKRRSAVMLDELCERLHECVCARPGESMAAFADEVGVAVRDLQRPMARLKSEGRVRSAGQRSMMRYFPAVARASKSHA